MPPPCPPPPGAATAEELHTSTRDGSAKLRENRRERLKGPSSLPATVQIPRVTFYRDFFFVLANHTRTHSTVIVLEHVLRFFAKPYMCFCDAWSRIDKWPRANRVLNQPLRINRVPGRLVYKLIESRKIYTTKRVRYPRPYCQSRPNFKKKKNIFLLIFADSVLYCLYEI